LVLNRAVAADIHVQGNNLRDEVEVFRSQGAKQLLDALLEHGVAAVSIERVLSPPWTTDWISAEGREKLRAYGIAPPEHGASKRELLLADRRIACPQCNSQNTEVVSEFGSTACKAAYKCSDCLEPFEYFKCI
jgi:ring-1,2-phenylacetyl-CoA epoxidase subunit PaaD